MRQEYQIGLHRLSHLPQEMARSGRSDHHNWSFHGGNAAGDAVENVTNGLRWQIDVAVLLAMFDSSLHGLFDGRIEEPGRQIARAVQIRLHHGAAERLPDEFG